MSLPLNYQYTTDDNTSISRVSVTIISEYVEALQIMKSTRKITE